MSIPCPVSMLPGSGGKAAVFVLAALVVLAIAASQAKKSITTAQPGQV